MTIYTHNLTCDLLKLPQSNSLLPSKLNLTCFILTPESLSLNPMMYY